MIKIAADREFDPSDLSDLSTCPKLDPTSLVPVVALNALRGMLDGHRRRGLAG
jgi:hypothetical protein